MMGTFQLTENDTTLVLEFFTVVEEPDGIKFNLAISRRRWCSGKNPARLS